MPTIPASDIRYAIYFLPAAESALARAGAEWLGWDVAAGRAVDRPSGLSLDEAAIAQTTKAPRKYGFHGTLKAPFRVKDGFAENDVVKAFQSFMESRPTFRLPHLTLTKQNGFFALRDSAQSSDINQLAADAVRHFEPLRAPLTEADYQKRKPDTLSDQQRLYLDEWGYPYVFEEFRFHITLTDKVTEAHAALSRSLEDQFPEDLLQNSSDVGVAVCRQIDGQPFSVLSFEPLKTSIVEAL